MKAAFTAGTRVRFTVPDSALCVITDYCKDSFWRVPGYLGDGFYLVETIPDRRRLVVQEDDLVLDSRRVRAANYVTSNWRVQQRLPRITKLAERLFKGFKGGEPCPDH